MQYILSARFVFCDDKLRHKTEGNLNHQAICVAMHIRQTLYENVIR